MIELKNSQIKYKLHCILKNITFLTMYILSIYMVVTACGCIRSNKGALQLKCLHSKILLAELKEHCQTQIDSPPPPFSLVLKYS